MPYLLFCGGECYVHSLKSTSGATPANNLMASIAAGHFPTCISRGGTWIGFNWAITCTEDERATIVATMCKFITCPQVPIFKAGQNNEFSMLSYRIQTYQISFSTSFLLTLPKM